MHLVIGQTLLNKTDEAARCHAALHLNASGKHNTIQTVDCIELSKPNLQAAKHCKPCSDFSKSASFLHQGLSLSDGKEKWTKNCCSAIKITQSLATTEVIVGDIQSFVHANQEVLFRAKSSLLKHRTIFLEAELALAASQPVLVPRFCKIPTENLEMRIPKCITPLNAFLKLKRVRQCFRKCTDDDVLSLPRIADNETFSDMRVLVSIASDCPLHDKHVVGACIALLKMILSFSHGLCECTSTATLCCGQDD